MTVHSNFVEEVLVIFCIFVIVMGCLVIVCYNLNKCTRVNDVENSTQDSHSPLLPGIVTSISCNLKNECAVCLELFNTGQQIRILDCGHYYHSNCVDPWLSMGQTCPKCRGENVQVHVKNVG